MLTGRGSVDKAVEAMKEGAIDFLEKPADINKLMDKISEAKERRVLLVTKNIEEKVKGILKRRA
jgi:FixJ family two-component response regulator